MCSSDLPSSTNNLWFGRLFELLVIHFLNSNCAASLNSFGLEVVVQGENPVGDGFGFADCSGEGELEDVGVGEGVGFGDWVGLSAGLIDTPLFQTNLIPDLIQVNFLPL